MPRGKVSRPRRIHRIARKLAKRYAIQRPLRRPLCRRQTRAIHRTLIAYDLETTRIAEGDPELRYITAFGEDFYCARAVTDYRQLGRLLRERFLLPETNRARFVAWNGNHFDAYFIARALLDFPELELKPYFARGNKLRGLMVRDPANELSWEFLDGIAMTGIMLPLRGFLEKFAPDFEKLKGPDFEAGEEFDASNPEHRKYAIRDSEGLWHAMMRAQSIVENAFGLPLSPTIGATGIRIFQRRMPEGKLCWQPPHECLDVIRRVAYRGGYCVAMRRFRGKVWKYDVNQAYAAAMRETDLPAGRAVWSTRRPKYAVCWLARCSGSKPGNRIPFYYRQLDGSAAHGIRDIADTWLTNVEVAQLEAEGWRLTFSEFWIWDDVFRMTDFVGELEQLRSTCEGGPSGAIGSMIKAVGNNAYGKTVEQLDALEIRLAKKCPPGFSPYDDLEGQIANTWFRLTEPPLREYHQPQVGAWITASVRMKIRRAALLSPESFLYADTDAVIFSRPIGLPLHRSAYGLWKLEADGERYIICNKKVYASADGKVRHAKGLNVDRLTVADFEAWHDGRPPTQVQLQRRNWLRFLCGEAMFLPLSKVGQIEARKRPP